MAGRTVYVGNVSAATDEATLRDVFGQAGPVVDLRIAGQASKEFVLCRKPGYNTVYCFVEFAHPRDAQLAEGLNGTQLGGRTVRVSMAKSAHGQGNNYGPGPAPALPDIQNFDPGLAAALYSASMHPSSILQAEAQARLMHLPAFNAQLHMSNIQFRNNLKPKKPHHDPLKIQRTVYVESVAATADEKTLADHFAQFGTIMAVRLASAVDTLKRKAWIEFADEGSAQSAQSINDQSGRILMDHWSFVLKDAAAAAQQRAVVQELAGSMMKVRPSRTAIHTNTLMGGMAPGAVGAHQHRGLRRHESEREATTSSPLTSTHSSSAERMPGSGDSRQEATAPSRPQSATGDRHSNGHHAGEHRHIGTETSLAKRGLDKGTSTGDHEGSPRRKRGRNTDHST